MVYMGVMLAVVSGNTVAICLLNNCLKWYERELNFVRWINLSLMFSPLWGSHYRAGLVRVAKVYYVRSGVLVKIYKLLSFSAMALFI